MIDNEVRIVKLNPKTSMVEGSYMSVALASRATGIDASDISKAINGKRDKAGGFIWTKRRIVKLVA